MKMEMDPYVIMELAKKNLKSSTSFFTLNPIEKIERAIELYERAANQFKINKQYLQSAEAFKCAAECYSTLKDNYKASCSYSDAAYQYSKGDDNKNYILYMKSAIELALNSGNFRRAGKYCCDLAEYYEKTYNLSEAIVFYEKVAEYYEESIARTKALLSVADLSAQLEKYDRSIEIYETAAEAAVDAITKWSAKDYLFKAGLCHLCIGDLIAANRAITNYPMLYPGFTDCREYKLLVKLLNNLESDSVEQYTADIYEYDQVSTFSTWVVTMLTRIKTHFGENIR